MKTTLESAKEQTHVETVNVLQAILEKNYDAEKSYKKAMQNAKTPALKNFLKKQAVQRSHFATAIDKELHKLDETPIESGSISGILRRAWIDIKSSVAGNEDDAVLKEVIHGEKESVEDYEKVMRKNTLAPPIHSLLQSQLNAIKDTLSRVKTLQDIE